MQLLGDKTITGYRFTLVNVQTWKWQVLSYRAYILIDLEFFL